MSEKPCFLTSHVAGPPHPVMYRSCNADKNWKNGKRGGGEGGKKEKRGSKGKRSRGGGGGGGGGGEFIRVLFILVAFAFPPSVATADDDQGREGSLGPPYAATQLAPAEYGVEFDDILWTFFTSKRKSKRADTLALF